MLHQSNTFFFKALAMCVNPIPHHSSFNNKDPDVLMTGIDFKAFPGTIWRHAMPRQKPLSVIVSNVRKSNPTPYSSFNKERSRSHIPDTWTAYDLIMGNYRLPLHQRQLAVKMSE